MTGWHCWLAKCGGWQCRHWPGLLTGRGILLDGGPQPGEAAAVVIKHANEGLAVGPACRQRQAGRTGMCGSSGVRGRGAEGGNHEQQRETAGQWLVSGALEQCGKALEQCTHPWPPLPPSSAAQSRAHTPPWLHSSRTAPHPPCRAAPPPPGARRCRSCGPGCGWRRPGGAPPGRWARRRR